MVIEAEKQPKRRRPLPARPSRAFPKTLLRARGTQSRSSAPPRNSPADTDAYVHELSADNKYSEGEEEEDGGGSYGGDEKLTATMIVSFQMLVEGDDVSASLGRG